MIYNFQVLATLFCLTKLDHAYNLHDLTDQFRIHSHNHLFSYGCKQDELLIVGKVQNNSIPMYVFTCGHHNPCGSSLNCILTKSDSCTNAGEYTNSVSREIFGIASICCKYDLVALNLDEHCDTITIQANATVSSHINPTAEQSPNNPDQTTPNPKHKSNNAREGKEKQATPPLSPAQSPGKNKVTLQLPVVMYSAEIELKVGPINDRAVKSIVKQSNREWQVTMCTLSCRRSTTTPEPEQAKDSETDSEMESEESADKEFDNSQESDDPCDVDGEDLQKLLNDKRIHGYNGCLCTTGTQHCKVKCRNQLGAEYIAGTCIVIPESVCEKRICICVTKKQNEDTENNHESEPVLSEEQTETDSGAESGISKESDSGQEWADPCDVDGEELQRLLGDKMHGSNGGVCTTGVQPCKINCHNLLGSEYQTATCIGIPHSGCKNKICMCVPKKRRQYPENLQADFGETDDDNDASVESSMPNLNAKSQSDGSKPKSKSQSDGTESQSKSQDSSKTKSKSQIDGSKSTSKSQESSELKSESHSDISESGSESKESLQLVTSPDPSATCFSDDTLVTTRNGLVRMDQLMKCTEVLVQRQMGLVAVFEPVDWFIHRDPNMVSNFIDIINDKGHHVTLSPNHLIPISNCQDTTKQHDEIMFKNSIFARNAKVDMCMFTSDKDALLKQTKIIQIRSSVRTGIYAPITASGSLIVNDGILVSCYSQFESQLIQQTMFNIFNSFSGLFDNLATDTHPTIDISMFMRFIKYVGTLISL